MGRPTKRYPETEQAILNALRVGNTRTDSALAAGISRETLRRWMDDVAFSGAVEKAEAEARLRFVGQIAKAAAQGNWQAAAWNLERRDHENWGRRERVDIHLALEAEVRRLANEHGVDYQEALAEAERILASAR
jgi:hypothetical protein